MAARRASAALDAPDRSDPLNKRSYGRTAGAVAAFGVLDAVAGVTLAEGIADALALAARFRPASIAAFGAGGLAHPATVAALATIASATLYPDADRAGHAAADALQAAIERHGGRLRRADLPPGMDAASMTAWRRARSAGAEARVISGVSFGRKLSALPGVLPNVDRGERFRQRPE